MERNTYISGIFQYEEYTLHGNLHQNQDIPARIVYNYRNGALAKEEYYKHGRLHRETGPAVINYYGGEQGSVKYYLNGEQVTSEDLERLHENAEIDVDEYNSSIIYTENPRNRCSSESFSAIEQDLHNNLPSVYLVEKDGRLYCFSLGELKAVGDVLSFGYNKRTEISKLDRLAINYQVFYDDEDFKEKIKNLR
jgi:hypothetical protein